MVAEPEAEPQHHTAGFTAYTNGALVPEVKTIFDQRFFLNNVILIFEMNSFLASFL